MELAVAPFVLQAVGERADRRSIVLRPRLSEGVAGSFPGYNPPSEPQPLGSRP